jgi:N-acyl-D-amino-acid deacylase
MEDAMADFDIIIRRGTVVDGTGGAPRVTDVGVTNGRVACVGDLSGERSRQEIDARGLVVAPGVINPHTHYDAQIYWDPYCTNSGWHGVTGVVVGNCGFGFSPCRKSDRERYMLMMENTEQVPLGAMRTALPWDWESYPEWIASVRSIKKGINLGAFLPMNSLMMWVMGYEAAKTRPATVDERAEMRRLLHEAMDCGALGFGFSYLQETNSHKDVDGSPMITDAMHEEEAINLARVLAERGEGVIQALVETSPKNIKNRKLVEKLAEISGRPVLHTVIMANDKQPSQHRAILKWLDETAARGLQIYSQALCFRFMPMAFVVKDFDGWQAVPIFNEFQHPGDGDTIDARVAKALDPDYRARLGRPDGDGSRYVDKLLLVDAAGSARLAPFVGKSFEEIGRALGQPATDAFMDLCAETRLSCEVWPDRDVPNVDYVTEINAHPRVLPGTSDGGAHVKFWSGGQYGTDLITWLVRDEKKITLEHMHHKLSAVPAEALGWKDRGVIKVGNAADIMIYDLQELGVATTAYETVRDLPEGDWRRVARAKGVHWILVNGEVTFHDNICTGATPGRLLGPVRERELAAAE